MPALDLPKALEFLDHDQALLHELLGMVASTLEGLQMGLEQALAATDAGSWRNFYRALHSAKPTLVILGSAASAATVDAMCLALAQQDNAKALQLSPATAHLLQHMRSEVLAACAANS